MRGIPSPRSASARRAGRSLLAALVLGTTPVVGQAQNLVLPTPEFEVIPGFEQIQVRWVEVPVNAGRRAAIDSLVNWDADSSSTVEFLGEYIGECDFRIIVERVPQDDALGTNFRITTKLLESEEQVGSPLAIDTLNIFEPGIAYPLDASIAPNTSIRFSPNVNQPSTPMGTIPVTTGGLNTSLSRTSTYFATVLNSVTNFPFGSDSLVVKVVGPVTSDSSAVPNPRVDTLVVRSTTERFPVMNGMTLSFGSGSAAPGDTAHWSARYLFSSQSLINIDVEAFEGYHIWRGDHPNVDSFILLGEIRVCESKFELAMLNEDEIEESQVDLDYDPGARMFTFTDFDIHNDFPYRYSITTYDRGFLGNDFNLVFEGQLTSPEKVYPGQPQRDASKEVFVVPNPYIRHAAWEEGEAKVVFTNLPPTCTIRIFTEAADHVTTVNHGPNEPGTTSPTTVTWNLKTEGGEDLVPGVYIYYVEGSGIQSTGKMMVAR
jgi:hypothetical protein